MKKMLCFPLCLLLALLLAGAAPRRAPVLPTVDFYVNDAANLLFEEHRNRMMTVSTDLDEKTGAQLVVLAIEGISGGGSLPALAEVVFADWEIGGQAGNGVLILIQAKPTDCVIYVGEGLRGALGGSAEALEEELRTSMGGNNPSKTIFASYKSLATQLYEVYRETPSQTAEAILSSSGESGFSFAPAVVLAGVVLITGRSMRIARRNQKRHRGPIRKRKSFTKPALDEDKLPHPDSLRTPRTDGEIAKYDEPDDIFLEEDDSTNQ